MKNELLDRILSVIHDVAENEEKLEKILSFLEEEIVDNDEFDGSDESGEFEFSEGQKKAIKDVAEWLACNSSSCLNLETYEVEQILEFDKGDDIDDLTGEKYKPKYESWNSYMTFDPLKSYESFKIMDDFVGTVTDENLQKSLIRALNRPKPFSNFNGIIHNSQWRNQWFDFRQKALEAIVGDLLKSKLNVLKFETLQNGKE